MFSNQYSEATLPRVPAVTLSDSLTVIHSRDCFVTYMAFANYNGGALTVTVEDGVGKKFLPAKSLDDAENTAVQIPEGGIFFKGGVKAKASVASKCDMWIRVRE